MSLSQQRRIQISLGITLFAATAAFVLWQNAHVAVLWDLSYLLDSSYRIALGQIPYRDFPFAHAPITFLLQAAILRLTGRVYFHHVLYAAVAGATATLLTWHLLQRLLGKIRNSSLIAAFLAITLVPLGIYGIYPHPIYDSDTILFVLLALSLLQGTFERPLPSAALNVLAGISLIPPLFCKQNIGLFFLASTVAVLLLLAAIHRLQRQSLRTEAVILLSAALALGLSLAAIQLTAGLHPYLYWTFTFAAQRRLPGLGLILGIYHQPSLLWTVPCAFAALFLLQAKIPHRWFNAWTNMWARTAAFVLLTAPFLFVIASTLLADDPSDRADALLSLWPHLLVLSLCLTIYNLVLRPITFQGLLPLILLATVHGTFLSQQLWGSTYAIWPLLALLIACFVISLPEIQELSLPVIVVISAVFFGCGLPYALSHDRLGYIQMEGPLAHSTNPALRGLSTPGPWIPAFDELISDTARTIPANDLILLFPGQDPFYYASGRVPRFPVLMFDPATNPYSPRQLAEQVQQQNVRWLILHRQLQLAGKPMENYNDYLTELRPLFVLDHTLSNYEIYRRRQSLSGDR